MHRLLVGFFGLFVGLCVVLPAIAAESPAVLQLFSRSPQLEMLPSLMLAPQQSLWLQQKKTLLLGCSYPDNPPFDILINPQEFEGISADYAGLISHLLATPVAVKCYPSRQAVLQALQRGEVDFVTSATPWEVQRQRNLVLSSRYGVELPVLITRLGDNLALGHYLTGKRLAVVKDFLPEPTLREHYPQAQLMVFPTWQAAIGAVALKKADVYLGNLAPLRRNYLNNLQVAGFANLGELPFAFGVRKDNVALLTLINQALAAVPGEERVLIQQRWNVGRNSLELSQQPIDFTDKEQQWMVRHPLVRVVISDAFAPLTFIDEDGHFRGISADLLELISLRTGLKFSISTVSTVDDGVKTVLEGEADMIGALTRSDARNDKLLFSRPWLTNAFVLVTREANNAPTSLETMSGKKMAIIQNSQLKSWLQQHYPTIKLVEIGSAEETLTVLNDGNVDGAINSLVNTNYQLMRFYTGRLRIAEIVDAYPAQLTFAVSRHSPELVGILDKVLRSIPPDEIDMLSNRWRPNHMVLGDGFWRTWRHTIIQGLVGAGLILLIALVWGVSLRRQISRRKRTQRALRDQLKFMRDMIDGTPHPIYVRDLNGSLILCNAHYLNELDITQEDAVGKKITEQLKLSRTSRLIHRDYLYVLKTEQPLFQDRQLDFAHYADPKTVFHWVVPYHDSQGQVAGIFGGWLDISDRQQLQEQLRTARDTAETASRAKTSFLSTMSHEIRTPLNAIIGMLELAMKQAEQGKQEPQALEVAFDAANGLVDLVGDILDIARIESGHMTLTPERADIVQLSRSVLRIFEGIASQKGLLLTFSAQDLSEVEVLVDPLRYKQILSNLLSNAIKFTSKGQVSVMLCCQRTETDVCMVKLLVEDTGIGISLQDQQRLFTPFSQAANNEQSARQGAGLGLSICRTLCEMMEGTLQLSSQLGQGTLVQVNLQLVALDKILPTSVTLIEGTPLTLQPLRALVVDDYRPNRLLLEKQLRYLGHQVSEAPDGAIGLCLWLKDQFDVVITDCNMPNMDGYALAREIRHYEQENGLQPCLLLGFTANAQPEERQRCQEAGMDGCLFKPSTLHDLSEWLEQCVVNPSPVMSSVPPVSASIKILQDLHPLTGGDPELEKQLLTELIRSNREDTALLAQLIEQKDTSGLSELAHKLKGGARMIKAYSLVNACDALEDVCNQPDIDLATVLEAAQVLNLAMNEFGQTLHATHDVER